MSKVTSWVLGDDNCIYDDPVIEGEGFFICWDDEEPPEIVVKDMYMPERHRAAVIQSILDNLGLKASLLNGSLKSGYRVFEDKSEGHFTPSCSGFLKLEYPIPHRLFSSWDRKIEVRGKNFLQKVGQGVIHAPNDMRWPSGYFSLRVPHV